MKQHFNMVQNIKIKNTFTFTFFDLIQWNPQKSNNQCPGDISSVEFKTLRPFLSLLQEGWRKILKAMT